MLGSRSFDWVGRGRKLGKRDGGENPVLGGGMQVTGNAKIPELICAPGRCVLGVQRKLMVCKGEELMLV